jgi:CHASE3 domain sensor protein
MEGSCRGVLEAAPDAMGVANRNAETHKNISQYIHRCAMNAKSLANKNVPLAFGTSFVILVMVATFSYRSMVASSESDRWVRHAHDVIENLQGFLLAALSIESSTSRFVLTGEAPSFDAYRASIVSVEQHEAILRNLTLDNAEQQRRLAVIEELTARKIRYAEMIISLRRTEGSGAAANAVSGSGLQIMDELQTAVLQMREEELRLLAQRGGLGNLDGGISGFSA